jgi:sulfate adenylyltransferase
MISLSISTIQSEKRMKLITPHGGKLVNREVKGTEGKQRTLDAAGLTRLSLNSDFRSVMTPRVLIHRSRVFLVKQTREVVSNMRLASGVVWPIPITLAVTADEANTLHEGRDVALYQDDHLIGVLHLTEKYTYDKKREAEAVYRTTDPAHPGVRALYAQGDWLLGGPITLVDPPRDLSFPAYRLILPLPGAVKNAAGVVWSPSKHGTQFTGP